MPTNDYLSPVIVEQLGTRGVDAVAVSSRPDLRALPDPDILEAAAPEGRVLVIRNVGDFIRLDTVWASTGRRHAGILCVAARKFPENRGLVGALTTALAEWAESGKDISGAHWFL